MGPESRAAIGSIADLGEGQECSTSVTIGESEIDAFIRLTGDTAPVHTDANHARQLGFPDRIAHGLLVGSMYSTLLGLHLPGPNTVIVKLAMDLLQPVMLGDTLEYRVRVTRISEAVNSVTLSLSATNQHSQLVNRGSAICVFKHAS